MEQDNSQLNKTETETDKKIESAKDKTTDKESEKDQAKPKELDEKNNEKDEMEKVPEVNPAETKPKEPVPEKVQKPEKLDKKAALRARIEAWKKKLAQPDSAEDQASDGVMAESSTVLSETPTAPEVITEPIAPAISTNTEPEESVATSMTTSAPLSAISSSGPIEAYKLSAMEHGYKPIEGRSRKEEPEPQQYNQDMPLPPSEFKPPTRTKKSNDSSGDGIGVGMSFAKNKARSKTTDVKEKVIEKRVDEIPINDQPAEASINPIEGLDPLEAYMASISDTAISLEQKSIQKAAKEAINAPNFKKALTLQPTTGTTSLVSDLSKKSKKKKSGSDSDDDEEEDIGFSVPLIDEPYVPKKLQKKVLEEVDHTKVDYSSYRKEFYIAVPEVAKMTAEQVKVLRKELDGIKIRGTGCPNPIKAFTQCGLSNKILTVLSKCGYSKPTPIQAQAIPAVMSGRDVVGIAKTGSGKTLAFLLPMFRHIADQSPVRTGEGPIGLIMVPTRELAVQIHEEAKKFKKGTGIRSVCVYGGAGVQSQIGKLKRGSEIVVCTPGRMIDILSNKGRITNLARVTMLVLDEADRMFDMGFEPQITKIISNIRPDRQTLLFSATLPRAVESAARKILKLPIEMVIRGNGIVADTIEQHVKVISENDKLEQLMKLVAEFYDKGSILVFVDRQEAVDQLWLQIPKSGYSCLAVHGAKDQADRESAIKEFKEGKSKILVATSVAARGLDVPHVRLVVNFDVPNHLEDYVHRVGRTGRAGNKGTAWTFITPEEDKYAKDLVVALKGSNQPVPDELTKIVDQFNEKHKKGLAPKRKSGFSGSGFQFDEQEALAKAQEMKLQRMAYGVLNEDDDEDELENLKAHVLLSKASKTAQGTVVNTATASGPAGTATAGSAGTAATGEVSSTNPSVADTKEMIAVVGNQSIQAEVLEQVLGNSDAVPIATTQEEVKLRAKLLAYEFAAKAKGGSQRFSDELEINDYPQQAKRRVTQHDSLASIMEFTGCGVTTKGSFFAPGQNVPLGDRKLYLLIDGPSMDAVRRAKIELKRIMDEACVNIVQMQVTPGRYQVV